MHYQWGYGGMVDTLALEASIEIYVRVQVSLSSLTVKYC